MANDEDKNVGKVVVDEDKEMHDSRLKWLIEKLSGVFTFGTKEDRKMADLARYLTIDFDNIDHVPTDVIKEAFKVIGLEPLVGKTIKMWCSNPDEADTQDFVYKRTAKVELTIRFLYDVYHKHWEQHRCQTCKFCNYNREVALRIYQFTPNCNGNCKSRTINRTQHDIDTNKDFWEARPTS